MTSSVTVKTLAVQPPGSEAPGFFRPARALVGWIAPEQAHQLLMSGRATSEVAPDVVARARSAREFAAARAPVDQNGVVMAPPIGIGDYLAAFRQNAANLFEEGFRLCTVDLVKLYALQPTTFSDLRVEEVASVEADDTRALAEITLPTQTEATMAVAPNPAQKTVTLSSPNLNLQVVSIQVESGDAGFSVKFQAACPNSMLQVAHFDGRYFCRDGHTRALQLLIRGITTVPAILKEFGTYAEVAPGPNLLPEAVTLGSNPPTLADFLDDRVSAAIRLPMTRKLVVVSVTETELLV